MTARPRAVDRASAFKLYYSKCGSEIVLASVEIHGVSKQYLIEQRHTFSYFPMDSQYSLWHIRCIK